MDENEATAKALAIVKRVDVGWHQMPMRTDTIADWVVDIAAFMTGPSNAGPYGRIVWGDWDNSVNSHKRLSVHRPAFSELMDWAIESSVERGKVIADRVHQARTRRHALDPSQSFDLIDVSDEVDETGGIDGVGTPAPKS